jgi:diguanylate cyclase (GGDEF)-like protein/PAS domain S-box-containing protein
MVEQDINKERLELALEAAGLDLWENDLVTGNVTHKATKIFAELGYSEEETSAYIDDLFQIIHPDDMAVVKVAVNNHLIGITAQYRCEFRIRAKSGVWVWYANYGRIMDRDGVNLGKRFVGVTFNIDDRKRKEDELAFINHKLTEQNAQLERLNNEITISHYVLSAEAAERQKVESELSIAATSFESQESMIITDANGVILRVNKAFIDTTGYTAEEAVGQTPRLLKSGRHNADFYREMWETIHRTGKWRGEVWDRRKNGEVYPKLLSISAVKKKDGAITHYVGSHIDITERKVAEDEIKMLAFYDPLTHLPNRRLLLDRLKQALASSARSGRGGALLFIDLDNFKTLNDTLGHNIGDILLQEVAQRLESCVREGDTVARLGGDEFVVMLEDLSEKEIEAAAQTEAIGEKILASLIRPYQLASHDYRCTSSIGATLFNDYHQSIDELLKQADIAMYQAKNSGRNALRFFDQLMQDTINARASLEGELHKALENHQFHLYYQIQVNDLHSPLGAETLIRWIHPERGLVSPAQFIPLAEETGMILPIGQWVLEAACAQIKEWQQDANTRNLVLAVNVSAKQFRQADFVTEVQSLIQRHAINPMLLKIELTEGMLLDNIDDTIQTMTALHEFGVQFSLDDFGTGYSSLQYLKQLPLDQLKIDQSFVRDIAVDNSDKAIVSTIIAMAKSLGLDVIAEGVETEVQRQFLLDTGCTHYQGYLFGKPVPIEQFEILLRKSEGSEHRTAASEEINL